MNTLEENSQTDADKRNYEEPVAWLLGRQLLGSIKGVLLYTAYGKKLDPRDWMEARVFPSPEKAAALKGWRSLVERRGSPDKQQAASQEPDDEKFWRDKKEFWFDYISDTGDGMIATYTIAYLCLSDLYLSSRDAQQLAAGAQVRMRENGEAPQDCEALPRGEFLFIGGDTAYHVSDYMTLANRVKRPFDWAYKDHREDKNISDAEPNRPLFGIPGNHDYYDQLDGFRRQFRHTVKPEPLAGLFPPTVNDADKPQLFIAGFNRAQEASYVALRLPFGWWFWGLDTEVGQIDERQEKFFRDLYEKDPANPGAVGPPKKLIVATCAPTTVFGKVADKKDHKAAAAIGQLGISQPFLPEGSKDASGKYNLATTGDAKMQEHQCRLDISGDVHHYARYWGPKPAAGNRPRAKARAAAPSAESYASVVSGIGGAFHHPSATYVDEVQEQVLYPSERDSTSEVARRIFKFWNIWNGGYIWLAGFLIAFIIYFASSVPQSSSQVINHFAPLRRLCLVPKSAQPITPTTMPLSSISQYSVPAGEALKAAASEPVTPFLNRLRVFITRSAEPVPAWTAQAQGDQNPHLYFYGPDRVKWPWDFTVAVWIFLLSWIPLVAATFSKKLFNAEEKAVSQGAEGRPTQVEETPEGSKITPWDMDPEINARPEKWLWIIAIVSSLMVFYGLAAIRPYRAHITPFGSSMIVLLSLIWAASAVALSIRYSEFLFKKCHRDYIGDTDWALTWVLSILSVLCAATGLWLFGKNNLPALLVSDMVFVLVIVGTLLALWAMPFALGAELLQSHGRVARVAGKFLIGLWHAVLQICVPFLLVRKGTYLTWIIALALLFLPFKVGEIFLRKNSRAGVTLTWIAYGLLMLALPYLTGPPLLPMSEPFMDGSWIGWWGLVPSVIAGVVGAVVCCVWFGWYLAVSHAFNGHNNEVGGAARIEQFKQFIRFRLTEDGLTAYVIGVDNPVKHDRRHLLKPILIDVFHLKAKPHA